ncbi:unnamed protein product, partial [Discosporangium mesarthrocarpum]
LFVGLLSKSAKAAVEECKRREAGVMGPLEGEARDLSARARAELAAVGLPGSLEAHESQGGVPESVWVKASSVRDMAGGLPTLRLKVREV